MDWIVSVLIVLVVYLYIWNRAINRELFLIADTFALQLKSNEFLHREIKKLQKQK